MAIRITTASWRRRRSFPRRGTSRRSCRGSPIRTTRRRRCTTSASMAPTSSIASCSRTWPGSGQFMRREAVLRAGDADAAQMIWLASKCVGRWPSGASLVMAPRADDPQLADRDDFSYSDDPAGLACPIGAHVRRSHPRDAIPPYPPAQSLSMSEAHRLLRRARVFGAPLFDPAVLVGSDQRPGRARCSTFGTMARRAGSTSSASTRASGASSSSCSRPGATTRDSAASTRTGIR